MITRYTTAITSGTVMTFGLLYVMQLLIALQPGAASEPRTPIGVDWRLSDGVRNKFTFEMDER
jgi:hypothetical protein